MHSLVKPGPVSKDTVALIIKSADAWESSTYLQKRFPNEITFIKDILRNPSIVVDGLSDCHIIAFGDKLKRCLATITETPVEAWYDQIFKAEENSIGVTNSEGKKYTNRELLQLLGTECGRAISSDIWVNALFASLNNDGKYIITDVRFKNEADACIEAGGYLIRINRNVDQMEHSSETSLDDYKFDYIIDNNGSIENLISLTLTLLKQIKW